MELAKAILLWLQGLDRLSIGLLSVCFSCTFGWAYHKLFCEFGDKGHRERRTRHLIRGAPGSGDRDL